MTTMPGRWVPGGIPTTYAWAQCRFCGRAQANDCPPAACMLCGTVQCFGNGSGNGCCAVCHHGYLPGWSRSSDGRTCGKKGCEEPAASKAPRAGQVCTGHAATTKVRVGGRSLTLVEYATERVAHRDSGEGHRFVRWRFVV